MSDQDDDAFAALIAQWDKRLADAGAALDAEAPPPALWERISARIDDLEAAHGTRTVGAGSGVWEPTSPGVQRKRLHIDANAGWQAFLVRIDPGATVPAHAHPILEECLVLEGAFELDGQTIRKGDFHLAFAGHGHSDIHSPGGALLYIRASL
ncbi:MAG TPA: cupin domain-containing protein [Caulobacteraceae bacterium]